MEKLLQMVLNKVIGRLVNVFVDRGFRLFTGDRQKTHKVAAADEHQTKATQDLSKRARDLSKIARKLW